MSDEFKPLIVEGEEVGEYNASEKLQGMTTNNEENHGAPQPIKINEN